jgi:cobalt-zinc-cadmium resistance protein CzcA
VPGTGLAQSLEMQKQIERTLKAKFPEIERVFARTGTAEVATDVMPPSISDGYIMLRPEQDWPAGPAGTRRTRDQLLADIRAVVQALPGNAYEFSQPIQLRFNELISGVRSDVAVKLFGDDMAVLEAQARTIAAQLGKLAGATEVKIEQTGGLPFLNVDIDREKAARYGLSVGAIQDTVSAAIGGKDAGTVFQGDRRFGIVVRLPETSRSDPASLGRLPLALPNGQGYVPLSDVATLNEVSGPNQVSREDGKRRIVVSANVRGRDIASFVEEAQAVLDAQVRLPAGYWMAWGGQFEQLQSATQRLQFVVPLALGLVLTLLFMMFGNLKDGLLVFSGIPFALSGGILALALRGIPLSISAAVGFIALSGVAVLNGLVMLTFIRSLREGGKSVDEALREGALTRLRPVLMTALVASLGFVPMALATGTGAEVQRPLATVVIGGILSSTALTLLVLPVLYRLAYRREAPAARADALAPSAAP